MVTVAQYMPEDPREWDSVRAMLVEHPELEDFIAEVSDEAHRRFPEVRIAPDTVGYDDWDPPLQMLVHGTQPWTDYRQTVDKSTKAVRENPNLDRELILVMPMWDGPIEAYVRE